MKFIPENKMLEFHADTLESVRKLFDLDDEKKMKESLDLLQDWVKKQEHFVKKDFDQNYLERMLIASKGSVERTKERLDRACTLRNLMPQYFEDIDFKETVKDCFGVSELVVLPKLTDENIRYFVLDQRGDKFTPETFVNTYKFAVGLCEYVRAHDYPSAFEVIIDYRPCKLTAVLKAFNILDLRDLVVFVIEGYAARIKGIHLIADASFMEILLTLAKQVVPKKIADRIHIHKSIEDLHKMTQKNILPIELGGEERSIHDLFADWVETLNTEEFRKYWRVMRVARTDESKRRLDKYNDKYLGLPGSFRTLSVD